MRPDEEANRAQVERDQRMRSNVGKGVATAATLAGAGATARLIPFLSRFIPADLAMKGLNKVSPKIADFLKRGESMGLKVEDGLDYLRNSLNPKEEKKAEPAKQDKNIIQQYSPELHEFIMGEIQKGRSPIEAGAIAGLGAKGMPDFRNIITKLTKDHKSPWSAILESVYGQQGGQKAQGQPQQPGQQQQQPGQAQGGDKWSQIASQLQNLLNS